MCRRNSERTVRLLLALLLVRNRCCCWHCCLPLRCQEVPPWPPLPLLSRQSAAISRGPCSAVCTWHSGAARCGILQQLTCNLRLLLAAEPLAKMRGEVAIHRVRKQQQAQRGW